MSRHFRMMVVADSEPHEIPGGWYVHSAVTLRNTGANATVAVILVEEAPPAAGITELRSVTAEEEAENDW